MWDLNFDMENISQWVGIDVSKATLDVYIRPMGKAMKIANTEMEISTTTGSDRSCFSQSTQNFTC
uniref:hypothetical protein n=1 Tax=Calothrix rhizosoleniae TaxID=888997 RepID=UPI001F3305D7